MSCLPDGWEEAVTDEGRLYYIDTLSGETHQNLPMHFDTTAAADAGSRYPPEKMARKLANCLDTDHSGAVTAD